MKIQEKFNKRGAQFLETLPPSSVVTRTSAVSEEFIKLTFYVPHPDQRELIVRMSKNEALELAVKLIMNAQVCE